MVGHDTMILGKSNRAVKWDSVTRMHSKEWTVACPRPPIFSTFLLVSKESSSVGFTDVIRLRGWTKVGRQTFRAEKPTYRLPRTVDQINQELRREYWATRLSICLFARTAHSFACSELLASLARSAALTRLPTFSLLGQWIIRWRFFVFFFYFGP